METFKKTKIVATLGPATNTYEKILAMAMAGANVFRLNFSHGTNEDKLRFIQIIREINEQYGYNIPILADLQGPKLRIGKIKDEELVLALGDKVAFSNEVVEGTKELITVTYKNLDKDIAIGNKILIDDGKIEVRVVNVEGGIIQTEVIQEGKLSSNKGFNLPDTQTSLPALTKKDLDDVQFILTQNVEWIALSFVRSAEDIKLLREILLKNDSKTKIIAKIEKPEAVINIKEIINSADGIMIARGDLGVEIPIEKVPLIQKDIIKKCIHRAKPVIVATQMMESMMTRTKPNRSEITDVANAVIEGTDAVMLSGETAVGKNPVLVIETMSKIVLEIEKKAYQYDRSTDLTPLPQSPNFYSDAICYNTCKIAREVKANMILGMTQSGLTGFTLSSYRPSTPLFVFANNPLLVNQLTLSWGVRCFYFPQGSDLDTIIEDQVRILKDKGLLQSGDIIVTTGSVPVKEQIPTNMLKIHYVK